ncbi:MAG: carboxymuconolactone decarboxylase family protein [Chloroflexi bacterium]|nr:carboxymuconolactone decarboxylase family protein [Chloroflexota bacterium]
MPDLPERTPYFRSNEHFAAYFKEVHAGDALDAKTKELIHLALVLALHCEP